MIVTMVIEPTEVVIRATESYCEVKEGTENKA